MSCDEIKRARGPTGRPNSGVDQQKKKIFFRKYFLIQEKKKIVIAPSLFPFLNGKKILKQSGLDGDNFFLV